MSAVLEPTVSRRTLRRVSSVPRLVVGAAAAMAAVSLVGAVVPADPAVSATRDVRTATSTQLYGAGQYRSPTSEAAKAATALQTTDPAGARAAATIAQYPVATWLGEWATGSVLTKTIDTATAGAAANGTTAVFVVYAIPDRDCGGYSAGGFDERSYDGWVDQIVARLAGKRAAVVVEPDSLAMLSNAACTSTLDEQRYRILSRTVAAFTAAGVPAYLDAGNSNWVPPGDDGRATAAGRCAGRARVLDQRRQLLPDGAGAGVRAEGVGAHRRRALRDRHVAERAGLARHLVQRAGRRPGHRTAGGHGRHRTRRAALGEDTRRERRHVQRRTGSGQVVLRVRTGPCGERRARDRHDVQRHRDGRPRRRWCLHRPCLGLGGGPDGVDDAAARPGVGRRVHRRHDDGRPATAGRRGLLRRRRRPRLRPDAPRRCGESRGLRQHHLRRGGSPPGSGARR
ncbi:glycoside hydrolase family 6 protein [Curtobacterium sp. MCJR17_043]|nr:glycoside hydrolase family 6 protein [Curtobacterium sp. MCJR17_043]WIB35293.1 glycoside hydrolase family 6 protein [Curtobacterium sp. MCJR17_043]